jgi:alanyl-tRNA synthetase
MLATKDEALEMAIDAMRSYQKYYMNRAINACKEALEQPAWQGLTDDEIVAKVFENDELLARILYLNGVSKALKQALEEKNHGI